jgi:hypothetical protein
VLGAADQVELLVVLQEEFWALVASRVALLAEIWVPEALLVA